MVDIQDVAEHVSGIVRRSKESLDNLELLSPYIEEHEDRRLTASTAYEFLRELRTVQKTMSKAGQYLGALLAVDKEEYRLIVDSYEAADNQLKVFSDRMNASRSNDAVVPYWNLASESWRVLNSLEDKDPKKGEVLHALTLLFIAETLPALADDTYKEIVGQAEIHDLEGEKERFSHLQPEEIDYEKTMEIRGYLKQFESSKKMITELLSQGTIFDNRFDSAYRLTMDMISESHERISELYPSLKEIVQQAVVESEERRENRSEE